MWRPFSLIICLLLLAFVQPATGFQENGEFVPFQEIWRLGHGFISNAEWSPDGKLLAVGTGQGIRLYNNQFDELDFWEKSTQFPYEWSLISWSPDSQYLAVAGYNEPIQLYNVATKAVILKIPYTGYVFDFAWKPDSTQIIYSTDIGGATSHFILSLWDIQTQQEIAVFDEKGLHVEWSLDGNFIYTQFENTLVKIDLTTNKISQTFGTMYGNFKLSPDGNWLAYADAQGLKVWNTTTTELYLSKNVGFSRFDWHPTSQQLWLVNEEGVSALDIATGNFTGSEFPTGIREIRWNAAGNQLVYLKDNAVYVWDKSSGETTLVLQSYRDQLEWTSYHKPQRHIAWSPDSNHLAVIQNKSEIGFWDVTTNTLTKTIISQADEINSIDWSSTNQIAAIARDTIYIWDAATGELIHQYATNPYSSFVLWSPDGQYLAADFETSGIGNFEIMNIQTDEVMAGGLHWDALYDLEWGADGQFIATTGGWDARYVQVWDAKTGEMLDLLQGIQTVSWSPDGKQLATTNNGLIQLRDIETGLSQVTIDSGVSEMAWSGNYLATNSDSLTIYDTRTGATLQSIPYVMVESIIWSPDGRRLAAIAFDYSVRVWEQIQ